MNSHDSESKEYSVAISVTDSCRTLTNEDSMTGIPASKVALSPIGREKALASSFPDSKMHTTRASDDDDLESGRFSEETSTVNPLNTLYSDRGLSLLKPADLKNQDWEHGRVLSEARFRSSMGSVSERVPSVRVPRQNSNPTTTAEIEAARILTEQPKRESAVSYIRHNKYTTRLRNYLSEEMKLFTPHSSSPTPYSYKGSPPVPVFYCGICLENHALSDGFTFKYCVAEHKFCLDCITSYTAHQISMGVVHHICPLETCRVAATDEELQTLVDEETFNKYLRFKKLKSDPDYRECSKCNSQINHGIRSLENSVIDTYIISCENCGNKSCFLHGDAHSPDESCKQYARRMRRTEKESQQLLNRISKKCPECKVDTEKSGGCNHMTCRNCNTNWCWLCGRRMEPNHFDRTNFAGCPGRQFASAPRIITCPSFIQCHNCFCLLQQMNALLFYLGKAFDLLTIVLVGVVAGCFALVGLIAMLPIILPAFIAKQILRLDRDCCDWYILPLGIGAIGAALVLLVLELIWLPIYFLLVMFTFGSIISEDGEEQLALQARPVILIMTMVIVDDD